MVEMTQSEVLDFLDHARIGRLCMADRHGQPYAIPFPFLWADGSVYLRVALTGRKGEFLQQNPRVCFEVDEFTDTLDDYSSVIVEGELVEVHDVAEKARIREQSTAKYQRLRHGNRPGHGRSRLIEDLPLRRIVVERIAGRKKEPLPASPATL